MSAPDTNVEKQADRHKGPLWGMGSVLIWAGLLFAAFLAWTAYQGDDASEDVPAAAVADSD